MINCGKNSSLLRCGKSYYRKMLYSTGPCTVKLSIAVTDAVPSLFSTKFGKEILFANFQSTKTSVLSWLSETKCSIVF